jgi:hypothetical protein
MSSFGVRKTRHGWRAATARMSQAIRKPSESLRGLQRVDRRTAAGARVVGYVDSVENGLPPGLTDFTPWASVGPRRSSADFSRY